MEFFKWIGVALVSVLAIAFAAFISGTILYWIWPIAIPAAFPGLIESGMLASKLLWWEAVFLTWVFGILVKSSQTNTSN